MFKKLYSLYTIRKKEKKNFLSVQRKTPQYLYQNYCRTTDIEKNSILYESYAGRGMLCNPYSIFKHVMNLEEFSSYEHYWIIDDFKDNEPIMKEYESYPNVHFIQYKSDSYFYHLATSEYLINNVAFPGFFSVRSNQHYINTWHGIPLKTIGFDIPGSNLSSKNSLRNFLMCDYLISPNDFMTDIYKQAFRLDGVYPGTIIQEGQPRNDCLFHTTHEESIKKLTACGVQIDPHKKLILYAPTWRGSKYEEPDTNLDIYFDFISTLEKNIDTDQYQILIKPHQIVYKYIKNKNALTAQFIPAIIDANELLAITDILISDFSSIFFDFLATKRPILFYIPDFEEYKNQRGLYHPIDFLPGPVAQDLNQLPDWIENIQSVQETYQSKYDNLRKWACPKDNGAVCQRLLAHIFKNKQADIVTNLDQEKEKIFIHGGTLRNQNLRQLLFSYIESFDENKYDITLFVRTNNTNENNQIINSIPPNIRVLTYLGPTNYDYKDQANYEYIKKWKPNHPFESKFFPHLLFSDEAKRIIGNANFDCVMDFPGDNYHFSMILLHMSAKKHSIWKHPHIKNKNNYITALYPYYDEVIDEEMN